MKSIIGKRKCTFISGILFVSRDYFTSILKWIGSFHGIRHLKRDKRLRDKKREIKR
jgi:hypothetical protein